MTYSAEISRDNPTCILFVVDQSTSMSEKMATGKSKAEFVADALNKTIYTMITNCTKADGVRNYFEVGVIGYGGSGTSNGLKGALAGEAVKGGSAATSTLRSLISGKTLRCAIRDVDRYGRLVGQCYLPDGRDVAAEMIRSGAATEYCRYSRGYYGTC